MLPISTSVKKLSDIGAGYIVEVPLREEAVVALVVDGNSAGQLLLVLTARNEAPRLMPVRREFCAVDHGTNFGVDFSEQPTGFEETHHATKIGDLLLCPDGLLMVTEFRASEYHHPGLRFVDLHRGELVQRPDSSVAAFFSHWRLYLPSPSGLISERRVLAEWTRPPDQ
jgi:hypothetical protein